MNFKPQLCETADIKQVEEGLFDDGVWIAQKKYDGVRAYVYDGKIYSRSGRDITHKFPEFEEFVKHTASGGKEPDLLFDGEIVSALTEEFNDVAGRVHLKDKLFIRMASKGNPAKLMLFDAFTPSREATSPVRTLNDRMHLLAIFKDEFENVEVAPFDESPKRLLEIARNEGWEGIVLKKRDALYYNGRSFDWRKVKLFKEVQHSFSSYDDHPKGVLLIDGDRKVNVNGQQAEAVKRAIKENGSVKVEVQYLPQNGSQKWRFPSVRGFIKEAENEST
jgi:ATP-dependent DNA ligase